MTRILSILAILALMFTLAASLLIALNHEHGQGEQHATCSGECGCFCHAGFVSILDADQINFHLAVSQTTDPYLPHSPKEFLSSLDRPPEQFS